MNVVLVIEDEPVLRSSMARAIAKMPGVEVLDAGTVTAALAIIDARPPNMIVSDIDLPDRSGIELLGELGRRSLQIPILFVSGYLKAYGSQIPPHANVDVREKPIQLEEIRSIVQRRLGHSEKSTEHAPFAVADYIQLACIGRHSVVIDVESEEENGRVLINNGLVWTATDSKGEGIEAFRRLAFARNSVSRVRTLREDPGQQTIFGSWASALLEAARMEDEEQRDSMTGLEQEDWFGNLDAAPVTARSPSGSASPEIRPSIDVVHATIPLLPAHDTPVTPPVSGVNARAQRANPRENAADSQEPSEGNPSFSSIPPTPVSRAGFVWSLDPTPAPAASAVLQTSPEAPLASEPEESSEEQRFDEAWDTGIAALLEKDYGAAFDAFKAAEVIRPEDPKVKTNLKRLRELGHGERAAKQG